MSGKQLVPYADLVAAFLETKSLLEVARRFGVSDQTVAHALKRQGMKASDFAHRASEHEVIDAYKRLGNGNEVSKLLRMDSKRVYRIIKDHGIDAQQQRKTRLRALTETQEGQAVKAYKDGESMGSIAERHGCSANAILELLRRHGVDTRTRKINLPKEKVRRLYEEGLSYSDIALEMGCHTNTIARLIHREYPEIERPKEGPNGPRWRGGRFVHHGYVYIWISRDDPLVSMARKAGHKTGGTYYALEHRIVMARKLGRALSSNETVHHINGDREDNRIENLELWSGYQPKGQRVDDKVRKAMELLESHPELSAQLRRELRKNLGKEIPRADKRGRDLFGD